MAILKISHSLINANPLLLDRISEYFESMFILEEREAYTIFQVEKEEKIGDIQIVLEFEITDSDIIVSGHRSV